MKFNFQILKIAFITILITSCNPQPENNSPKDSSEVEYKKIPAERKTVNPDPIKTYSETVKSFETTDDFKVNLYETRETFHFIIKIKYKELKVEDTLKVPDFGIEPVVEIEKGDSIRPSCIVGFLDQKKQFRESKLVYFDHNKLKIHVLKHYAVYSSPN